MDMEGSFRLRVDKAFGSLSSGHSLWSLTDDEIQRNEWNREKEDMPDLDTTRPLPFHSNGFFFHSSKPMEKEFGDLQVDDGVLEGKPGLRANSGQPVKPDDYNDEEWEIKSSIGMDSTVDFEEEEDKYDKVAMCKENSGDLIYMKDLIHDKAEVDRMYMKEARDYETEADACDELPNSFEHITKDPRANHAAAKIRLMEDAEAAEIRTLAAVNGQFHSSDEDYLRSILKRKETQMEPNLQKRVKFDYEYKNGSHENNGGVKDTVMEGNEDYKLPADYPSGFPDFMRHPSRYTKYSFESNTLDEESNKTAYMDFLNMLKNRNSKPCDDGPIELPKSVAFVPKKKTGGGDAMTITSYNVSNHGAHKESLDSRMSFGVGDTVDDEVCAMEEDVPEIAFQMSSSLRSERSYRKNTSIH